MVSSTSATTLRAIARGRVLPGPRARGDGYAERQDPDVRILIAHLGFLIPDPPLAICLELRIMQFNHAVARSCSLCEMSQVRLPVLLVSRLSMMENNAFLTTLVLFQKFLALALDLLRAIHTGSRVIGDDSFEVEVHGLLLLGLSFSLQSSDISMLNPRLYSSIFDITSSLS